MLDSKVQRPKVPGSRKLWIPILIAILIAILITGVLQVGCSRPANEAEFQKAAAELPAAEMAAKAAGLKLTWEELEPEVPDDQNAAIDLEPLLANLEKANLDEQQFALAIARKDLTLAQTLFKQRNDALKPILASLSKPRFQVDQDRKWGPLGQLKLAVRTMDERMRCMPGRPVAAILVDLRAQQQLVAYMADGRSPENFLGGLSGESLAMSTMTAALGQNSSPEMLNGVSAMLKPKFLDWRMIVSGELLAALDLAEDQKLILKWWDTEVRGIDKKLVRDAYRARALQAYTALSVGVWEDDARTFGGPSPVRMRSAVAAEFVKPSASYALNRFLMESESWLGNSGAVQRSSLRTSLMTAFVKVLAFRNERGKLPASLAEANAEFDDPFSSDPGKPEPVGFFSEKNYFRLWSRDADRVDDQGLSSGDIRLEWPESRPLPKRRVRAP